MIIFKTVKYLSSKTKYLNNTYNVSIKKATFLKEGFNIKDKRVRYLDLDSSKISFPSSALQNRDVSILEAVVVYLKDKKTFSYHEIALLLNRDDRTIWTCYNRAVKKRGKE